MFNVLNKNLLYNQADQGPSSQVVRDSRGLIHYQVCDKLQADIERPEESLLPVAVGVFGAEVPVHLEGSQEGAIVQYNKDIRYCILHCLDINEY